MEFIKTFSQLGKGDAGIAGGKGASLGEMTQAGIPVPPGFVVLSGAFEHFLAEADLAQEVDAILDTVKTDQMHTVEHASEKIQALIIGATMPKDIAADIQKHFRELGATYVAVRSSATAEDSASAAWAGQLDSFLNTDEATVLKNVQRCWASLFTPRAIFYRFEKELHQTKISVAVVVQAMVASEVSGIAFSVHPVTEDRNQLIIEAGYGLGEAIVSGQVTPDSYVVTKSPRAIIDVNVSVQTRGLYRATAGGNEWHDIAEPVASAQVLTEPQILELSEIIVRIENHYGFPCDIEWAYEAGKFYIVQSRPITTLSVANNADTDFFKKFDIESAKNWVEQGRWILPPFVGASLSHHHMHSVYASEIFQNLQLKAFFYIDGYAFQPKQDKENIFNYVKKQYEDGTLLELSTKLDTLGKEAVYGLQTLLEKDEAYRKSHVPELLEAYRNLNDFWMIESYVGDLCIDLARAVGYIHSEQEMFGKVGPYLRDSWIEREVKDAAAIATRCIDLFNKDQITKEDVASNTEVSPLVQKYLSDYSWAKFSWWMGEPIDTAYAIDRINQEMTNVRQGNHITTHKATEPSNDGLIAISVASSFWRVECGMVTMMAGEKLGFLFDDIAAANGITKEDALQLTFLEVQALVLSGSLKIPNPAAVLERKQGYFLIGDAGDSEVIFGKSDPRYAQLYKTFVTTPAPLDAGELHGLAASPGHAKGVVRIVEQAKEFDSFKEGEILVAVETSPMFVPLMRRAAAILTGKGGITSHAAIVSRELKKPCIIAIKDIVKILKTGDVVEVDAKAGIVRILSSTKTPSPDDYIRMFANKSFPYLLSSIFLKYYDDLGVVSLADTESWMSFLPKSSHARTLKDGAELYTSEENYHAYKTAFDNYRDTSAKQFEKWLTQPTLNAEDVEAFLALAAKHFFFYSKTEFFYTDAVDPNNMVISVQEFDELKLSGRAWLNKILFEDEGYIRRLTRRLAKETGMSEIDILSCEVGEVVELVRIGGKPLKQVLADRVIFFSSLGYKVYGDAAKVIVGSFLASYREKAEVIKGTVAYKGKVRSKARVLVPDFNDFNKIKHAVADMQKGEILVAETTAPEIILACQKAAAIVTNQGGTLSHAAIVARELKIPCIIGTDKDVIVNIQTGDELEVDADTGVVRIISKAQRG